MTLEKKKVACFIDRDGTIVKSYGGRPANTVEEIELLPGVPEGIKALHEAGLVAVVVTNQAGVALGYMTLDTLKKMHERVNDLLIQSGSVPIDAFYYCTHAPKDLCQCRKPNPGMFLSAAEDVGLDMAKSYMIGDDARDMDAATRAGVGCKLMVISDLYQDTPMASAVYATFKEAAEVVAAMEKMK